MGCFASGAAAFVPRFVLAVWWLFGSKVDDAFGSWVWPLLGLVFLPWTTLAIVIAWQPGGLSGNGDALLVVIGVALDVVTYMHRFAAKAVRGQSRY
jgi:hypothetical protein